MLNRRILILTGLPPLPVVFFVVAGSVLFVVAYYLFLSVVLYFEYGHVGMGMVLLPFFFFAVAGYSPPHNMPLACPEP